MPATKVTVFDNGSIRVEGDFELVDQHGTAFGLAGRQRISLCRCGHSARMPFCDASHKTSGWESGAIHCRREPAPDAAGSTDAPAAPSA